MSWLIDNNARFHGDGWLQAARSFAQGKYIDDSKQFAVPKIIYHTSNQPSLTSTSKLSVSEGAIHVGET